MRDNAWNKGLFRPLSSEENVLRPEREPGMMNFRRPGRFLSGLMLALALSAGLTGCGSTETPLPDLSLLGEITVIAREEGSGTRSEFESLVDTTEEGATGTALSTDQMLELVENDENAIGYIAYSAVAALDADGAKILSVDGTDCSYDTIQEDDYPLTRDYLLAYSGELNDLETDFIRYVRSAGQTIVAQTCIPVSSITTYLSDGTSGTLTICGSSSMETLMEALIEDYKTWNPNATIVLTISDSTGGLNAVMRGEYDLAMSSRSLKDYEKELLEYKVIAADGVAVIVNEANPLSDISLARLKAVYDGDVTAWPDLK